MIRTRTAWVTAGALCALAAACAPGHTRAAIPRSAQSAITDYVHRLQQVEAPDEDRRCVIPSGPVLYVALPQGRPKITIAMVDDTHWKARVSVTAPRGGNMVVLHLTARRFSPSEVLVCTVV